MTSVASLDTDPLGESKFLEWKDDCGIPLVIPAIDARWLDELEGGVYNVLTSTDELQVEAWCANVEGMINTCSRLLNMPSHKFWSHMLHDSEVDKMIATYLEKCPRYSDPETLRLMFFDHSKTVCELQRTLHTLMFRLVVRIATPRPPNEPPLDTDFHGHSLMTGLMDVARFTDVCCVFGLDNTNLLRRMGQMLVNNVIGFQSDLLHFAQATSHVLEGIEGEISKAEVLRRGVNNTSRAPINRSDVFDLSVALSDAAYTIHILLHILPFSATAFVQAGVTAKLPLFLKNAWKVLLDEVNQQDGVQGGFSTELREVLQRLRLFEATSLQIFRSCIVNGCFSVLQDAQSKQEEKDMAFDSFQTCLTACCDNQTFAVRYFSKYPLENDLQLIAATGFYVDPSQVEYLNEGISQSIGTSNSMYSAPLQQQPGPSRKNVGNTRPTSNVDFTGVIREISEILPEENPAFLQAMLARFDGNSEAVVNSILCSDVPHDLENIRLYGLPDITSSTQSMSLQACAANTFPNIEPDPVCSDGFKPIEQGKKHWQWNDKERTELKDDKMQHIFDKFRFETEDDELVRDGEMVARVGKGAYEDEYDDTYDTLNIGAHDIHSSEDESNATPPRPLHKPTKREDNGLLPLVEGGFSKPKVEGGIRKDDKRPNKNNEDSCLCDLCFDSSTSTLRSSTCASASNSNYTGGRQRQLKDRHRQHNRKNAHDAKLRKGMF